MDWFNRLMVYSLIGLMVDWFVRIYNFEPACRNVVKAGMRDPQPPSKTEGVTLSNHEKLIMSRFQGSDHCIYSFHIIISPLRGCFPCHSCYGSHPTVKTAGYVSRQLNTLLRQTRLHFVTAGKLRMTNYFQKLLSGQPY